MSSFQVRPAAKIAETTTTTTTCRLAANRSPEKLLQISCSAWSSGAGQLACWHRLAPHTQLRTEWRETSKQGRVGATFFSLTTSFEGKSSSRQVNEYLFIIGRNSELQVGAQKIRPVQFTAMDFTAVHLVLLLRDENKEEEREEYLRLHLSQTIKHFSLD